MADKFLLESELPGPQQAPEMQPQASSNGLLDVLGAIGSGLGTVGGAIGTGLLETLKALPEISAYRQAALGNAEPLKQMQEQKQQKQLRDTLQATDFGEYTPRIQNALQMGGVKEAQKVAAQIPVFKSIQSLVKGSNLTSSDKEAVLNAGLIDPNRALDLYRSLAIIEKQQVGRQAIESAKEQRELRREERKVARFEQKLPGNILASELEIGKLKADDVSGILGVLQARGVKIPGTRGEQQLWVKNLLASPALKKYIPTPEAKKSLVDGLIEKLGMSNTAQPQAQTAQPEAQPAAAQAPAQGKRLYSPSQKRYFIQRPDGTVVPE
jgi:hypothetical protein